MIGIEQPFSVLPRDVIVVILQLSSVNFDIPTNQSLFLVCKLFNAILKEVWRQRFPTWQFDDIPRAPVLIPNRFATIPLEDYMILKGILNIKFWECDLYVPKLNVMRIFTNTVPQIALSLEYRASRSCLVEGRLPLRFYPELPARYLKTDITMIDEGTQLVFIQKQDTGYRGQLINDTCTCELRSIPESDTEHGACTPWMNPRGEVSTGWLNPIEIEFDSNHILILREFLNDLVRYPLRLTYHHQTSNEECGISISREGRSITFGRLDDNLSHSLNVQSSNLFPPLAAALTMGASSLKMILPRENNVGIAIEIAKGPFSLQMLLQVIDKLTTTQIFLQAEKITQTVSRKNLVSNFPNDWADSDREWTPEEGQCLDEEEA